VYEPRKGLPSARECGRYSARGEVIANLDADCLPESEWLAKGAPFFKDQRVVAVSGPYDYYDGPAWFRRWYLLYQRQIQSLPIIPIIFGWGRNGGWITGGNSFIRARALQALGGYDTTIEFWGEDVRMAKMLSRIGRVIYDKNLIVKTSARRFFVPGSSPLKGSLRYVACTFGIIFRTK
jgi:cellulose synthase/poly-beta-1,6-N-acetylglucosamine synthase-like glycosyltransferase